MNFRTQTLLINDLSPYLLGEEGLVYVEKVWRTHCYIAHDPTLECCLQAHSNVEVSSTSLSILFPVRLLNQEDFSSVHQVIKIFLQSFLKHFLSNWQRITTDLVILAYVEGYKIPCQRHLVRLNFHHQ